MISPVSLNNLNDCIDTINALVNDTGLPSKAGAEGRVGSNYSVRICGTALQARMAFQSEEGVFWVTMLSMQPADEASNR